MATAPEPDAIVKEGPQVPEDPGTLAKGAQSVITHDIRSAKAAKNDSTGELNLLSSPGPANETSMAKAPELSQSDNKDNQVQYHSFN